MSGSLSLPAPVALGVAPPAPAGLLGANPLASMELLARMRAQQNQDSMFRTQFAAKSKAGQIAATAPDFETALKAMQSDPDVAGYAPDVINSLRQTQNVITQTQGLQAGQNRDAVQAFVRSAAGALGDPSALPKLMETSLSTLPEDVRKRTAPAFRAATEALLQGLPSDPAGAKDLFQRRLIGQMASVGMSPESISMQLGTNGSQDLGNRVVGTKQDPVSGAITPVGVPMPRGLAPSMQNVQVGGGATQQGIVSDQTGMPGAGALPGMGGATVFGGAGRDGSDPGANARPTPAQPGPVLPGGIAAPAIAPIGAASPTTRQAAANASAGGIEGKREADEPSLTGANAFASENASSAAKVQWARQQTYEGSLGSAQAAIATSAQRQYQELSGKNVADQAQDMDEDLKTMPTLIKRSDMMLSALKEFQAGGMADTRDGLGKLAQGLKNMGFPITEDTIKQIGNGSLSGTAVFEANVKPMMVAQLKAAAQGTGRVMKSEVDAFMQAMDKTTDPQALLQLLNQARYTIQVGYDRANKWAEFKKGVQSNDPRFAGEKIDNFQHWYINQMDPNKLPQTTPGGLGLGPNSGQEIRGITPEQGVSQPSGPRATPATDQGTIGAPSGAMYFDPVSKTLKRAP